MKRITKVKYDGTKIEIRYQQPRNDGEPDEYEIKCRDLPHADFGRAFDALLPYAEEIAELPGMLEGSSRVRGVSLTWSEDDTMGACITVLKNLDTCRSPLVINTPHLPAVAANDAGAEFVLPEKCIAALEKVIEEALAYLDGKRAQGSLFGSLEEGMSVEFTTGDRTVTLNGKKKAA